MWDYEDRGTTCGPIGTAAPAGPTPAGAGKPAHVVVTPTKAATAKTNTPESPAASKIGSGTLAVSGKPNVGGRMSPISSKGLMVMAAAGLNVFLHLR